MRDKELASDDRWWLLREIEVEERLDALLDRALRRLAQMKAMKEVLAARSNSLTPLAPTREEPEAKVPLIEAIES